MTTCHYCGTQVDPDSRFVWHRVIGWERKAFGPSRRSGSDIALREQRDEHACDSCIVRMRSGISPTQERLV